jgi:hypothetical protein
LIVEAAIAERGRKYRVLYQAPFPGFIEQRLKVLWRSGVSRQIHQQDQGDRESEDYWHWFSPEWLWALLRPRPRLATVGCFGYDCAH